MCRHDKNLGYIELYIVGTSGGGPQYRSSSIRVAVLGLRPMPTIMTNIRIFTASWAIRVFLVRFPLGPSDRCAQTGTMMLTEWCSGPQRSDDDGSYTP